MPKRPFFLVKILGLLFCSAAPPPRHEGTKTIIEYFDLFFTNNK
jgi:hypothetical protein